MLPQQSNEPRRECGEPSDDGSGRVCRRVCAPGRDYHGGGHWYADPSLDGDAVRKSTARWIVTGEQPAAPLTGERSSDQSEPLPDCSCAMTEASMWSCPIHGLESSEELLAAWDAGQAAAKSRKDEQ